MPQYPLVHISCEQRNSLDQHAAHLRHIEELINKETLAFMSGQDAAMTATQARLQAGQVQSGLSLAAQQKASMFEEIQMLWCSYTGEEPTGSLEVAAQALEAKLEPQQVEQLKGLADGGYLSKETTLELLQRGGVLPITFDVEEEVQLMEGRDQALLKSQLERDRRMMEEGFMAPPNQFLPGN